MIPCLNCQQPIDSQARFCQHCGIQISPQAANFQQSPYIPPPTHQAQYAPLHTSSQARRQKGLNLLIGGIIVMFIAIAGFFFLRAHSPYQSWTTMLQRDFVFNAEYYDMLMFADVAAGFAGGIATIFGIINLNSPH